MSSSFAGTQEYMAMEKLGQLRAPTPTAWDLIVVDTPPTRSALDFLDAPAAARVVPRRAADPAAVGAGARPAAAPTSGCVGAGVGAVTGVLTKVLGAQVLSDVQTFVAALDTMFGGFRERADATYRLLQAPGTAFVVVAAPERDALREASYFVERLAAERDAAGRAGAQPGAPSAAAELSAERSLAAAEDLDESGGHELAAGAAAAARRADARSRRASDRCAARFTAPIPRVPVVEVAARAGDVHDLAGLREIGADLAKS